MCKSTTACRNEAPEKPQVHGVHSAEKMTLVPEKTQFHEGAREGAIPWRPLGRRRCCFVEVYSSFMEDAAREKLMHDTHGSPAK